MAIDIPSLIQDPEFKSLGPGEKRQILSEGDPEFSNLSDQDIEAFVQTVPRGTKLAPSGRTLDQEALAQQFIASEQRPTSQKVFELAEGLGRGIIAPVTSAFKALPSIPQIAADPSRLLPTGSEAVKRIGLDLASLGLAGAAATPSLQEAIPAALKGGPARIVGEMVRKQLAGLASRTPTQQEVDTFLARQPLQEAIAGERADITFEGAQPELTEAITQITEAALPVKGLSSLKGVSFAKGNPARMLRGAIKPAKHGARVEKAAENTLSDIYHANPNADTAVAMPFEGFQQTVVQVQKQVGAQIDDGLRASGIPINAGDEMAAALRARADKLVKAGQPTQTVQALRDRASELAGQATDMDSLREAVTSANRSNSPLFQRTREAANPLLAQGDTIANEIIAKVGGKVENDALASVKGPEGANLRKKWADLNLINQEASKRLNTLINTAPAEIQSTVASVIGSLEGAAGIVALANGFASGIIPLATKAARTLRNNAQKALKDSNSLVTSAYEKLRANPPEVPAGQPPVIGTVPFAYNPSVTPPPLPAISPQNRLNMAMAQMVQQTPMPRQPVGAAGPGFVFTPDPVVPRVPPPGVWPPDLQLTQPQLAEVIGRLVEDEAAKRAQMLQGGSLGGEYF